MPQIISRHIPANLGATPPSTPASTGSLDSKSVNKADSPASASTLAKRNELSSRHLGIDKKNVTAKKTEAQVYTRDLVAILFGLKNLISRASSEGLSKNRTEKLSGQLREIAKLVQNSNGKSETLSTKEIALISLHFENIGHTLPHQKASAELKELTSLLGKNLASTWLQQERAANISQWTQSQAPSFKPGAASAQSLSLGVNAGVSLLSLPGAEHVGPYINAGIAGSIGRATTADDDGGMFADKSASVSGKISAGANIAFGSHLGVKAGGEVQYRRTRSATKIYAGPKQYAETEMHHQSSLSRNSYIPIKLNKITKAFKSLFHGKSEMQKIDAIQQQAVNGQQRLTHLLGKLGLETHLQAIAPKHARVNVDHYDLTSRHAKAEAIASVGLPSLKTAVGGGSITLSQTYGDIGIHVPKNFTEAIKENRQRLNELPTNYYSHAKNLIASTPKTQSAGTALNALGLLESDVKSYFNAVKEYDYQRSIGRTANPEQLKCQRQLKHTIEQRWGAIGRHQFIQFAAASHAYLADIISQSSAQLNPEQTNRSNTLISTLASRIYTPDINHSPRRLDKLINFDKQFVIKLDDNKVSFNLSAGPLSGTLDITHKNRHHPSMLREGKYIDISFTLTASAGTGTMNFIKDLNKKIGAQIDKSLAAQGIKNIDQYSIVPTTSKGISGTYMLRFFKPTHDQYQGESSYRKLFSRTLGTISNDADISLNANVAPSVSAGVNIGVSKSATRVLSETLGTQDLTYPTMMYKSFFERNDKDSNNDEWQDFTIQHQTELAQLFKHLGNPNERVYRDAQAMLNQHIDLANATADKDIIASANELKDDFTSAMQNVFKEPKNTAAIEAAQEQFNGLLESQVSVVNSAFSSRLEDKASVLSVNSALSPVSALINKITGRAAIEEIQQVPSRLTPSAHQQEVIDKQNMIQSYITPSAPTLEDIYLQDAVQAYTIPSAPTLEDIYRQEASTPKLFP